MLRKILISQTTCLYLLMLFVACTEPYAPPETRGRDFIVIDGFLNASTQRSTVRLSRAVPLNSGLGAPAVKFAQVSLISNTGQNFTLTEQDPLSADSGLYMVNNIAIDMSAQYKLKIEVGESQYESDFVSIEETALIESISAIPEEDGLSIRVNTLEMPGKGQYYRWKFAETWQYSSTYFSNFKFDEGPNPFPRLRNADETIHTCYRTDPSSLIKLGTTKNLSTNVIRDRELTKVPRESIKLSFLYSIVVTQISLSNDAYNYWLSLSKTSENLGGLFDPMPYQIMGNLHSLSSPNEIVIGYFHASTVEEKRIFVKKSDLPDSYSRYRPLLCQTDTIPLSNISLIPKSTLIIGDIGPPNVGFTTADPICIDCRIYGGGQTTKPAFWP